MQFVDNSENIQHIGIIRRSGRYPWGSGKHPFQRSGDFLNRISELREAHAIYIDEETGKRYTGDTAVAKILGLTTTQLRAQQALAKEDRNEKEYVIAKDLRDKGYSLQQIADEMGYKNDSSIRGILNRNIKAQENTAVALADFLQKEVDSKGMVDVGKGVPTQLNISKERLDQALYLLEADGYHVYGGGLPQVTNPGKQFNLKVLTTPDKQHKDIYEYDKIYFIDDYRSKDGGDTFDPVWVYPKSLDSKRLKIAYDEDGGTNKDGLVEIRRGVQDLDLGNSKYAQVRILVDNSKYIKGMAVYSDNIPDGYDLVFNTNKSNSKGKLEVLKDITSDKENPFGSLIKAGIYDPTNPNSDDYKGGQSYYIDKNGKKQLSLINKRATEGDWSDWKDKIPAQFLSKQPMTLINKQLDLAKADKKAEYDEIMSLNNPTVKKKLLDKFAEDCDSAATHLYAASLPRQKYHVILPINSLKDTEVFAPKYKNGEEIALVRYPHGGTFEIPILKVNNKNSEATKTIGLDAKDALGINSKVASILSGADFDGDTVMAIPTNSRVKIKNQPPLSELVGFDPKMSYPEIKGMTYMKYTTKDAKGKVKNIDNTQAEMGKISNLITDMTLKGATNQQLSKAVKHSMVVIDAAKHKLNYKQSEIDNDIKTLKKIYQGRIEDDNYKQGASTLISKSKSEVSVLKRKGSPKINQKGKSWYDPNLKEGEVIWNTVEETYVDSAGKIKVRTQKSTKMMETRDANTLSSGTKQENAYADYANYMKGLAISARKASAYTPNIEVSSSAKKTYAAEVSSLKSKLTTAVLNKPRERQAHMIANTYVKAAKEGNPSMTKEDVKKTKQKAITKARSQVGAKRYEIEITDREWDAIQSGAISSTNLSKILDHSNIDDVRKRATPKSVSVLTPTKRTKLNAMKASGNYTIAEMAASIGVSATTVANYL